MFRIVVVGGPAEKWVERCLSSIKGQKEDFTACVVLDPVGDGTYEKAKLFEDNRVKVILNEQRKYALPNIIKSINEQNPDPDDIIATVDADDWLKSENSLSIVKSYYDRNPELLLTHGSWESYPNPDAPTNNGPYKEEDFKTNIRFQPWHASHLRTYKYKLWNKIKDEDLRGPDDNYFESAWDLAFMWPMMEMAGFHRISYVPEKVYVYNQETPYSDEKIKYQQQIFFTKYVSHKPQYQYVESF
jgi:glycosyltransferase involved in cell wall biosynthesis